MLRCCSTLLLALALAGTSPLMGADSIANDADAQTLTAQAMSDLRAGDNDPQKTVAAALQFTQLLDYYKAKGDNDQVCEMQANVYWCKKRMNLDALRIYVAAKGAPAQALAARAEEVVSAEVSKDQADAYLSRADKFSKDHPDASLAIAIRYFEIADRFSGTPISLKAQRLSLEAQRKVTTAGSQPDSLSDMLSAQVPIAGELPDSAKVAIEGSNISVKKITSQGSIDLDKERQRAIDLLLKAADAEQKKGELDTLVSIQTQIAKMDDPQEKLPKQAQDAMAGYNKAKTRILGSVASGVNVERKKLRAVLDKVQTEEVRKGNTSGAIAIKDKKEDLTKPIESSFISPDGNIAGPGIKLPKPDASQNLAGGITLLYYNSANKQPALGMFDKAKNVAASGKATASSQYAERSPSRIFTGSRDGSSWTLDGGSGNLLVEWKPEIKGRYIVLINRTSGSGNDPWGSASVKINGKALGAIGKDFSGGMVLVIDLGSAVSLKDVKFDISGSTYPGLAGLEVYP